MTGLRPTMVASLAYSACAFISPAVMAPVSSGNAFRRTAAILASTNSYRPFRAGASPTHPCMTSNHFDYLVIGGGSGGVASARRAATYDTKVTTALKIISHPQAQGS